MMKKKKKNKKQKKKMMIIERNYGDVAKETRIVLINIQSAEIACIRIN